MQTRDNHPYITMIFNVLKTDDEKISPALKLEIINITLQHIKTYNEYILSSRQKEAALYEQFKTNMEEVKLNIPELKQSGLQLLTLDIFDEAGNTPLVYVLENNDYTDNHYLEIIKAFIQFGANPNKTKKYADFPPIYFAIQFAAKHKNYSLLNILLTAKDINLNQQYDSGKANPLLSAILSGTFDNIPELVDYLIAHRADTHFANSDGEYPIHIAARCSSAEIFKKVLKATNNINLTTVDVYHDTPLILASKNSNLDVVNTLIEAKADLTQKDQHYQSTPLSWAAYKLHPDVVARLIEARADVNAVDSRNKSILEDLTTLYGKYTYNPGTTKHENLMTILTLLLRHGAVISLSNEFYNFLKEKDQCNPSIILCLQALIDQQTQKQNSETSLKRINLLSSETLKEAKIYLQQLIELHKIVKEDVIAEIKSVVEELPTPIVKIIESYGSSLKSTFGFFEYGKIPNFINAAKENAAQREAIRLKKAV